MSTVGEATLAQSAVAAVPIASVLTRFFQWNTDDEKMHSIQLAADFTRWMPMKLGRIGPSSYRRMHTFTPETRGVYMYKYVVDGRWQHNPNKQYCYDADGNVNNVVEVFDRALHEHQDNFALLTCVEEGYPNSNPDTTIILCDGCQQERLEEYYHCMTCHHFDYCTACYRDRKKHAIDTRPASLASWVVATKALEFLEDNPPMQRVPAADTLKFVASLDAMLKRNGNHDTAFESITTEEAALEALEMHSQKISKRF